MNWFGIKRDQFNETKEGAKKILIKQTTESLNNNNFSNAAKSNHEKKRIENKRAHIITEKKLHEMRTTIQIH